MAKVAEPTGWWMYHGDAAHTGYAGPGQTAIDAGSMRAGKFGILHTLHLGGSDLSVPGVLGGFIYVEVANTPSGTQALGERLHKIALSSGTIDTTFPWTIAANERDTHGCCGMGTTPSVGGGRVYFVGFNAKLYCPDAATLDAVWTTDLRNRDMAHNQPVQTFDPTSDPTHKAPPAAG